MFTLANGISILRIPLSLFFLFDSTSMRLFAIVCAMLTDSVDGYLARRFQSSSRIGAVLDPLVDKLFAFFAMAIFYLENRIELWQIFAMASRDFSLCIFALYLALSKAWGSFQFTSIRWGKITTILQFFVLIAMTLGIHIPSQLFFAFIIAAIFAFTELYRIKRARDTHLQGN